ncbi:LGFP repeat-containing protein [Nocardia sp. NPDC050175]|uniref:LGFP repeat-containing protein n=1 Tax=Nocardia sp. NPDC050175 TaxID=3364317 RepID=UPI0037978D2C
MSGSEFDGLIEDYWRETGAEFGPYGRPTGPVYDIVDPVGRRQSYERGSIAWSRDQRAILGAARLWDVAVFEWKIVDTFHYDYFRYEVSHDGLEGPHINLQIVRPTQGRVWVRLQGFGSYLFRVKGCDGPTVFSGERSLQGWTALVGVAVGVTAGEAPSEHPPVTGLIAERWHLFGAWDGPLGLPVAAEEVGGGNYHVQRFERGTIAAYPDLGPEMAILAYQRGPFIVTHWGHIPNVNPYPVGSVDLSLFEAICLDSGSAEPEFKAPALYPDALWFDWAHDAASSSHMRFYPKHPDGQYLIRVTDPEGRKFGLQLTFHAIPVQDAMPALDGSPEHGYAGQSGRTEALARRFIRDRPVELFRQNNGEDITAVLTAHLHAAGQDSDFRCAPGEWPSRLIVAVTLHDIPLGQVGTDRDYDMTLKGLMPIAFRYPALVTDSQRDHLFRELVPPAIRGPHDPDIETVSYGVFLGPETENHLLMIESTRYLTNQYLFQRTGDARYDNLANGMFD